MVGSTWISQSNGFPYCICEGREATGSNLTPTLWLFPVRVFSTTLTSWCLSPQLPGWILEGFFYLNKQTALNEDYQDYYYHDHVVVIALTLQRKHTRWTRRRWVCHPLTSVTICRYRKYLIFLVKKSPFSAKAVIVYTGYFFMCRFLLVIKQTNTVRVSKIKLQHARVEVWS